MKFRIPPRAPLFSASVTLWPYQDDLEIAEYQISRTSDDEAVFFLHVLLDDLDRAKEILAWELTAMVHGDEEANKAQQQARALFGGGAADSGDAPVVEVTAGDLTDGGIALPALLVLAELCKSRSEARTNIQQGGVSIDGQVEKNFGRVVTEEELKQGLLLRRGKKAYKRIVLK